MLLPVFSIFKVNCSSLSIIFFIRQDDDDNVGGDDDDEEEDDDDDGAGDEEEEEEDDDVSLSKWRIFSVSTMNRLTFANNRTNRTAI